MYTIMSTLTICLNSLLRSQHFAVTLLYEDDHNNTCPDLSTLGGFSNVVVLICIITWQDVRVSVLHEGPFLLSAHPSARQSLVWI